LAVSQRARRRESCFSGSSRRPPCHTRTRDGDVASTVRRKARSELARFPTTTPGLVALSAWLAEPKVTHVAKEATGVYWKPVWRVLRHDFELVLANASHIRNAPGRKSDANDATWIADLLAHGLIRASFVPPSRSRNCAI
jgi:transposase